MYEIKDPIDAEAKAKEIIAKKHWSTKHVFFSKTSRQENAWLLEGQVWFRRFFFTVKKSFRLQLNAETGEVMLYEEHKRPRGKKECLLSKGKESAVSAAFICGASGYVSSVLPKSARRLHRHCWSVK